MVVDYREKRVLPNNVSPKGGDSRKQPPKNRPRREGSGVAGLVVAALVVSFGAGVGTGLLIAKLHKPATPAVAALPAKTETAAPAQAAQPPKQAVAEPPLTFYQTLPAGGKGAIGSGLNLKKPEAAPAKVAAPVAPAASPATPAAADAPAAEGHFVVQIASYRDKKDADALQGKLAGKGLAAYVVEARSAEKGIWYRLRVGKHLTKDEADDLAGKAGQGAIVLPE